MAAQNKNSRSTFFPWLLLLACIFVCGRTEAHSLPNSKAQLTINGQYVLMQFKTPVEILELASKEQINLQSPSSRDSIKQYFLKHVAVDDSLHSKWNIIIGNSFIQETTDPLIGKYQEIVTDIYLQPTNAGSLRSFTLNCDLIIHQIPNQAILFSVENDWQNGVTKDNAKQIGVISMDIPTGKIFPLKVQLDEGSWFKGFENMLALGMQHIKEGTDHLLFLITLLLPACLLVTNKKWSSYAGYRSSIKKLLKIVTAFTIGHSSTLLIGALGWVKLPSQPVEILIAVSIFISAMHAVYPIFANKEMYVAAGFGLIHGLAFTSVLSDMNLGAGTLALSILGFNLGIELMQLFIIALVIPWIMLLSKIPAYKYFRIAGASLAGIAAIAWIVERSSGKANFITEFITNTTQYGLWCIIGLAVVSMIVYIWHMSAKKPVEAIR